MLVFYIGNAKNQCLGKRLFFLIRKISQDRDSHLKTIVAKMLPVKGPKIGTQL